jgi:Fe-S cluster assembly iron-binding protein IscA
MVAVTTRAKEALAELRASAKVDEPDVGVRLAADTPGTLALFADRQKPGDQVVEHAGSKVLLIDEELAEGLTGAQIDCERSASGAHFFLAPLAI